MLLLLLTRVEESVEHRVSEYDPHHAEVAKSVDAADLAGLRLDSHERAEVARQRESEQKFPAHCAGHERGVREQQKLKHSHVREMSLVR